MKKREKPTIETISTTTTRRLPHDLILEILSRLPAKSILRFRCLSKTFKNSLSNPNFIKLHINHVMEQQGTVNLLLASKPRPTMRFWLETELYSLQGDSSFALSVRIENPLDLHIKHGSKLLGSCNGLVCLCSPKLVCLLNPFTKEYKIVKFDKEFCLRRIANGLTYDEVCDDYVLVQIVDANSDLAKYDYFDEFDDWDDSDDDARYGSEVSLYSLNKASCTNVFNIPYKIRYGDGVGIYYKDYLHWVASKKRFGPVIVVFDIGEEKFRELPMPVDLCDDANFTMGVLGGNVSILCDMYAAETELWVMKNYGVGESWVKLFSMHKKTLSRAPESRALSFCEKGKVLMMDGNAQVLYYPKLQRLWDIKYRNISWPSINRSVIYVPSLVPLNTGTYVEDVDGVQPAKKRKHRAHWSDWEDSEEEGSFDDDSWDEDLDLDGNIS